MIRAKDVQSYGGVKMLQCNSFTLRKSKKVSDQPRSRARAQTDTVAEVSGFDKSVEVMEEKTGRL